MRLPACLSLVVIQACQINDAAATSMTLNCISLLSSVCDGVARVLCRVGVEVEVFLCHY